jgi:hypothetical protein
MPSAEFLETYPLYQKFTPKEPFSDNFKGPRDAHGIEAPPIKLHCGTCRDSQTFRMVGDFSHYLPKTSQGNPTYDADGAVVLAKYGCAACGFLVTFFLEFAPATQIPGSDKWGPIGPSYQIKWVQKVGQHPEPKPKPTADLARALGESSSDFGKGQLLERLGFELGACAYYRRVVESLTNQLLQTHEKGDGASDEAFLTALAEARAGTAAAELHKLAKPLLPSALTEGDVNPLGIAYGELSEALHGATAARAKEIAPRSRELVERIFLEIAVIQEAVRRRSAPKT